MRRRDFDKVYQDYHKLVLHVAFDVLQDHGSAEEVCLEVFVEFYEKIKGFHKRQVKEWMLECAHRKAIGFKMGSRPKSGASAAGEKIGQELIIGCRVES